MEKDITILKLIERLKLAINFNEVEVVDYWETDFCAIGLIKENKLIYISTFNYLENQELTYDVDLEITDETNKERINVVRVGRNVLEMELVNEVKLFLEV